MASAIDPILGDALTYSGHDADAIANILLGVVGLAALSGGAFIAVGCGLYVISLIGDGERGV